jgi:hypothetical protein
VESLFFFFRRARLDSNGFLRLNDRKNSKISSAKLSPSWLLVFLVAFLVWDLNLIERCDFLLVERKKTRISLLCALVCP